MSESTSDPDVIFNRLNIALARSQRVLNSWVPPKRDAEDAGQEYDESPEEDFKSMREKAGLESKAAYGDDDALPDGAMQRKKLASNDKLLEQLLGSKAVHAKKKSGEPGKHMSTSKHAAPKQLTTRSKESREVSSEGDDEGGRAAVFKSKKLKSHRTAGDLNPAIDDEPMPLESDEQIKATASAQVKQDPALAGSPEMAPKAAKRKPTSYLDEMLAQRANKNSKKKKSKPTS